MAWAKLDTNTLSASSLDIDLGATTPFTAYKFNQTLHHLIDDGTGSSGDAVHQINLNNDSGSNYAHRVTQDGASDSTFTSQSAIFTQYNTSPNDAFIVQYYASISGEEILQIGFEVDIVTTGAGSAPRRIETVNKYTGTSQFTRLDCNNSRGTSVGYEYASGSNATIIGTD